MFSLYSNDVVLYFFDKHYNRMKLHTKLSNGAGTPL